MSERPALSLRQQRTLALTRLIGAVVAAIVLGYASVTQVLAGAPLSGKVLFLCIMTLVAVAYGWWCSTRLERIVKAEKTAREEASASS